MAAVTADGARGSSGARSPLRVGLVAPAAPPIGGQAVQAARLLERLGGMDDVRVEFLPVNPRLPSALAVLQRVRYVRTVATSLAYWLLLARRVRRLDVLHVFSASYLSFLLGPVPAIVAAKLLGCRIVLNYRSGEAEDHLRRSPWAVRWLRRVDAIVVPSGYLAEVFARFGLAARVVANFVEPDRIRYRRRPAPRPVFLSNRNLEPLYDVATTIRAFAIVQRRHPEARLIVAGEGREAHALEALVRSLALTGVELVGRVRPEEMAALYDRADIYINSPRIDNMPGSIIEAFAAGLPVVTTDAGGIPFVVTDGRTGLMAACGDADALASQALRVLEEPGLAARLATAARAECLDRYVWDAVRAQWTRLYRDVCGPAPRGIAGSVADARRTIPC